MQQQDLNFQNLSQSYPSIPYIYLKPSRRNSIPSMRQHSIEINWQDAIFQFDDNIIPSDPAAMDAPPPSPKRRRTGAQSQSSHQQQQPATLHDNNIGVDLLSSLHDDVLGSIITLLPTKDGARTQILSRRFLPLWRSASAPLNLEATLVSAAELNAQITRPSSAIIGALRAHPGPVRRVSLKWLGRFEDFPKLDALLKPHRVAVAVGVDGDGGCLRERFPCLDDSVREFELYFKPTNYGGVRLHPPPMASLLRFSRTLRVLTLCSAAATSSSSYRLVFPAAKTKDLEFPSLERLTLKHVSIADAVVHGVLSRCPALQSLVLHKNEGYGRLVIRSATLRSLGVSDGAKELVVEDAPLLERLIPRDLGKNVLRRIQVVHAPRLKTLGYLCDQISEFEMGTMVLKGMVPAAGTSSMIRTVKILALHDPRDFDVVIDLLKCFPCVEKLYMELCHFGVSNNVKGSKLIKNNAPRRRNDDVPIKCLDTHLKMLELRNYRGRRPEVSLIRFFLSNARVLEWMKFVVPPFKIYKGKWIVKQRKKLCLNIRASRGARFHFEINRCLSSLVPMEHIHNLAIEDPFGRSSCSCKYDDFK